MIRISVRSTRRFFPSSVGIIALLLLPLFLVIHFHNKISKNLVLIDHKTSEESSKSKSMSFIHKDAGGVKVIHFIESSGENCLRPRQACSIESAAVSNPDMAIHLHMATSPPPGTPEMDEGEGLERNCKTMDLIQSFPNVKIIREDLLSYLQGTSLEPLAPMLFKSKYANQHLVDAVRIALLYKLGGIYIDIDTLVFKSLRNLKNTAGHVFLLGRSEIENGFLIFDRGSAFLKYIMHIMVEEYKDTPDHRSVIGSISLTRAFREFCFHSPPTISPSIFKYTCREGLTFTLLNNTAFFPIGYLERDIFYGERFNYTDLIRLKDSYASHIYVSGHGAHVPETSLFAELAKKYCPIVYEQHQKRVYVF